VPLQTLDSLAQRGTGSYAVENLPSWEQVWFPFKREIQIEDGVDLAEACTLALFYSPKVREARAQARISGAQILGAGLLSNPELSLGPHVSTRDSQLIFPVGLSWELPLWGRAEAERDAADHNLRRSRLQIVQIELDTLTEVRASYLRLRRLNRELAVLRAAEQENRALVTWVQELVGAGEVDAVELFLARSELSDLRVQATNVEVELLETRRELLLHLGLLPSAPLQFLTDHLPDQLPEPGPSNRDALLRMPQLQAAEAAYAQADAELRLEIAKQYPAIQLGPEVESDRGDTTIGIGFGISLPFFDRNQGGIAVAEERRVQARQDYESTLIATLHEEAQARAALDAAIALLKLFDQGPMRDVQAVQDAVRARLETGRVNVLEVIATQRAIAQSLAHRLELEEKTDLARLRTAVTAGLAFDSRQIQQTPEPSQ
jgi:outer membrane protein TolC